MAKIHSKRVIPFLVPKTEKEIVRVQLDHLPYFYDQLHQHPEIQIMLIVKGEGTLVAGDYVGRFRPHDIFIIGSGQPHVFRCDPFYYKFKQEKVKSVSLYFHEDYGGEEFWNSNEWKPVRDFKAKADKGFYIFKETSRQAEELIIELSTKSGLERLICFCQLLKLLAETKNKKSLALQSSSLPGYEEGRMNKILEFTFRESSRKITIAETARLANLSEEAFCRYFKLHTRKTYISFLNELRISNACQLLMQRELSIQQISFETGFNNISNFNRIFKRVTRKTPLAYRKQLPFGK